MNIHMLQDKLIRERPKHVKQTNLKDIFKKMIKDKAAEESLFENPMPSASRTEVALMLRIANISRFENLAFA
ncbi:hypothetical protein M514_13563 [Trichuris suis]|uniref:Uncharacterized protein n=1 Tax=Trichuris suis TaxID=68888 RepID=A0A085LKR5_9BILA|nr:hypothetical protein M513_13563 [Trichuris suis]KFD67150.1 hypothetical protein M514_13563 [Trichuris suis]